MAALTQILVADTGEADEIAQTPDPEGVWPGMDAQGIDQMKLAGLWEAVTGDPYPGDIFDDFTALYEGGDEGPWVYEVPQAFVDLLAQRQDAVLMEAAERWARMGELGPEGWKATDVAPFLHDVHLLAAQAVEEDKGLLLWVSL